MKKVVLMAKVTAAVTTLALIFPAPALAYLDPGTGSYFIQILIGGLLGALFSIKMFWRNIRNFVSGLFGNGKKEMEEPKH